MRANSPSAIFASLALHATVAALLIVFSLYVSQAENRPQPAKFIELVAGPPTDPYAEKAPALGNSLTLPKDTPPAVNEPIRQPEPVHQAEPVVETVKTAPQEEVVPTPPKVTPKPVVKTKETPKAKTQISKEAKKIVSDMNNKRVVSYLQEKHKIDKARAKEEAARRAAEAAAAKAASSYKPVDARGIAEGVRGGSPDSTKGAGGKALVRSGDSNDMDVYEAFLKSRLKAAFDDLKPTGLSDSLSADVMFLVTASGEVGNVRITRSSGNAEFDAAVLQSFKRISWPGRRPDGKTDTWRLTFRMREED